MFVDIAGPARIYIRDAGAGSALIFLHGGWGYEVYPFDRQIEALGGQYRILIPDRSGYGQSARITTLPPDFHRHAAQETMQVMDALEIEQAVLWGHSDGAVIAALMGLSMPSRFSGLVLEAFHYTRAKTGSVDFFRKMITEPDSAGDRGVASLVRDHGEDWRSVLERNATAWLQIVESGPGDLYDGKLSELAVPALFIHGSRDPRIEPGDLEAIRRELPRTEMRIIEGAGHSPHSEPELANECTRIAAEFLNLL
jgi:pimeloyl-ACP methyl ester carboxylesterase